MARNPLHKLLIEKYYVDEIYDALFVRPIYHLSLWLARVFDPGLIDGIVNGVATAVVGWAPRAPPGADRLRDELRARHPAGRGRRGRLPAGAPLAGMAYLLSLVTFLPMLGAVLVLLLPRRQEHVHQAGHAGDDPGDLR